ncbi:MAG: hypothetical protein ABSB82_15300 [Terriglobia bacterium]|jgi:hypothetical protein
MQKRKVSCTFKREKFLIVEIQERIYLLSWGEEHFDMSIPQNRNAVDEINKLPVYQPQ